MLPEKKLNLDDLAHCYAAIGDLEQLKKLNLSDNYLFNKSQISPILVAVQFGQLDVVCFLLEKDLIKIPEQQRHAQLFWGLDYKGDSFTANLLIFAFVYEQPHTIQWYLNSLSSNIEVIDRYFKFLIDNEEADAIQFVFENIPLKQILTFFEKFGCRPVFFEQFVKFWGKQENNNNVAISLDDFLNVILDPRSLKNPSVEQLVAGYDLLANYFYVSEKKKSCLLDVLEKMLLHALEEGESGLIGLVAKIYARLKDFGITTEYADFEACFFNFSLGEHAKPAGFYPEVNGRFVQPLNYAIAKKHKLVVAEITRYVPSLMDVEDELYGHPFFFALEKDPVILSVLLQQDDINGLGILKKYYEDLIIFATKLKKEAALKSILDFCVKQQLAIGDRLHQVIFHAFPQTLKDVQVVVTTIMPAIEIAALQSLETKFHILPYFREKDDLRRIEMYQARFQRQLFNPYKKAICNFIISLNKLLLCRESSINIELLLNNNKTLEKISDHYMALMKAISDYEQDTDKLLSCYKIIYGAAAEIENLWRDLKKIVTSNLQQVVTPSYFSLSIFGDLWPKIFSRAIAISQSSVADVVLGFGKENQQFFDDETLWRETYNEYKRTLSKVDPRHSLKPELVEASIGYKKPLLRLMYEYTGKLYLYREGNTAKYFNTLTQGDLSTLSDAQLSTIDFFKEAGVYQNNRYTLIELLLKLKKFKALKVISDYVEKHVKNSAQLTKFYIVLGYLEKLKQHIAKSGLDFFDCLKLAVKNGQNQIIAYLINEYPVLHVPIFSYDREFKDIFKTAYTHGQTHSVRYFFSTIYPLLESNQKISKGVRENLLAAVAEFSLFLLSKCSSEHVLEYISNYKLCSAEIFLGFINTNCVEPKILPYLMRNMPEVVKCFFVTNDEKRIDLLLETLKLIFIQGVTDNKIYLMDFAVRYFEELRKIDFIKNYLLQTNQLEGLPELTAAIDHNIKVVESVSVFLTLPVASCQFFPPEPMQAQPPTDAHGCDNNMEIKP